MRDYNQSINFGAGQRFGILQMRRSRQVPQSNGHSEPGTVEARYNGAAGITLRSSDLNGEGLVGETRRAALKHRGLLEPHKGAGFVTGKLGGTTDAAAIRPKIF